MQKDNLVKYGEICSKCWENEEFKARFIQDPEGVLVEAGIETEEGVDYKVVEVPKNVKYIVLPHKDVKDAVRKLMEFTLKSADEVDQLIPEGVEFRVIQNTDTVRYLLLPPAPKSLSAAELAQVSGGKGVIITSSNIITSTNVIAHAEAITEVAAVEATLAVTTLQVASQAGVVTVVAVV